jgi:hypothetical protein
LCQIVTLLCKKAAKCLSVPMELINFAAEIRKQGQNEESEPTEQPY